MNDTRLCLKCQKKKFRLIEISMDNLIKIFAMVKYNSLLIIRKKIKKISI